MPSPLAHISAGAAISLGLRKRYFPSTQPWRLLAVCLFFSMAPDLDAILGIINSDMATYHNNLTHSFFFGFMTCAVATPFVMWFMKETSFPKIFWLSYGCYAGHLIMDWMTYGRGLMLFWPVTDARFISPWIPFIGVRWSEGLWTRDHLHTIANELIIIGFCVLLVYGVRFILQQNASKRV